MMDIICFHNPDEDNGFLSNWYLSRFISDGYEFSSMEQYMMYHKAMCFNDTHTAETIMDTKDVAQIKKLGREVSGYIDSIWSGMRQIIVFEGLRKKFAQNRELLDLLLKTGSAVLAECAVKDRIWGIGLSMKDPDRFDMEKWRGQNLLGYSLMQVRDRFGGLV